MKRTIALLLALVMMFALVACAPKADEPAIEDEPVVEDQPAVEDEPAVEDQPAEDPTLDQPASPDEGPAIDEPASPEEGPADMPTVDTPEMPTVDAPASGETVGQTLLKDFNDRISANPAASAQELAEGIIANPIIAFMGGAMPMEPGFFSGFDNLEITEFKEASMFAPMMGTIPFVGYIFVLEDGADVEGFKQMLSDNANLRWNICTSAEELVVESSGNTVFFLMCPASMEA